MLGHARGTILQYGLHGFFFFYTHQFNALLRESNPAELTRVAAEGSKTVFGESRDQTANGFYMRLHDCLHIYKNIYFFSDTCCLYCVIIIISFLFFICSALLLQLSSVIAFWPSLLLTKCFIWRMSIGVNKF